MPSLKQIRSFLTIADLGGFTQAAAVLFVAQPALSRQIAQLEEELGFSVFERQARGISLTPAGARFRERVKNIDKMLSTASEEGRQIAHGEAGVLRLLHSSSVPANSLLPSIKQFIETAPGARVDLDRIASELQVSEIAEGRADVGIVRLPVMRRDPAVRFSELPAERLWVALPAHHRYADRASLALADLAEEAFVSAVHRERGGLARLVTDLCLRQGFVPRLAPVISRKTSMLNLVAAGFGIAVVPEKMTMIGGDDVIYRALSDADAVSSTALITPLKCSPLAQKFVDIQNAALTPNMTIFDRALASDQVEPFGKLPPLMKFNGA